MIKKRVIAVIIVRDGRVVQSVQFKHTNVIHYDAYHAVEAFNRWSVDEIVVLNVSKEPSSKVQFLEIISHISETCFVPLAVGGWIDTEDYAAALVTNGADKLVVNTILHTQPTLVKNIAERFGSQCLIGSIDVQKNTAGLSRVAVDRATHILEHSPEDWAKYVVSLGVGEILFNSVEYDGNRKGYDLENLKKVSRAVPVPVIAFGGVFSWDHMAEGLLAEADAVAAANIFHYKEQATKQAKCYLASKGFCVRSEGQLNYAIL